MENIEVIPVPFDQIIPMWPVLRPHLNNALCQIGTDKRYPIDQVLIDLLMGKLIPWAIYGSGELLGAAATEIKQFPLGRSVSVFLFGGTDLEQWVAQFHAFMIDYARSVGADWLDSCSRPGFFKKYYPDLGIKHTGYNFTFEV